MHTQKSKIQDEKSQLNAHKASIKRSGGEHAFQFADNRDETIIQRRLKEISNSYHSTQFIGAANPKDCNNNYKDTSTYHKLNAINTTQQKTIQRNSEDAEEETEVEQQLNGDIEYEPEYMPLDEILIQALQPFVENKIGSCVQSSFKVCHRLLKLKTGKPFRVGAVKIEFETGTLIRNHTAVVASWEDGTYIIDCTMGQFNYPDGVLICTYTEWLDILFASQPYKVTHYEQSFRDSGCYTDGDMAMGLSRFRGNEKLESGYKDNGESRTTEEEI